jgi:hypothetical protein
VPRIDRAFTDPSLGSAPETEVPTVRMHSRKSAWVQGATLMAVIAAIALAIGYRLQRPFDRDTLTIQVQQLQSSAAEAQVLADNVRADTLAPGVVRQHAQQLADKVGDTNSKLEKPAQPGLDSQRSESRRLGASLQQALMLLGRDGAGPTHRAYGFGAMAHSLDALHTQLKPAD